MPFFLTYQMLTGSIQRRAETTAEAAQAHREIRRAGGSLIKIADETGRQVALSELGVEGETSSPTVLVVEDDALIRAVACLLVEESGYRVVEAADADQAISILEARRDIRVVFTDVDMPGTMDGLKLAHYVRDRWPPIHLLLVSGRSLITETDLPAGAQFFSKPYQDTQIASALRQILV